MSVMVKKFNLISLYHSLYQFTLLLILLVSLIFSANGYAEALNNKLSLNSVASYLEDPTCSLSYDSIRTDKDNLFTPHTSNSALNFGYSHSCFWLKIPLPNELDNHLLEVGYYSLDKLIFYEDGQQPIETGTSLPFSSRPINHRFFIFPLQSRKTESVAYVRLQSLGSLYVPLTLWKENLFFEENLIFYFMQALYFGAVSILVLYNLMLYFAMRDKVYLVYVAFAFSMEMMLLSSSGFGVQLFWSEIRWLSEFSLNIFQPFTAIFGILLARYYLNLSTVWSSADILLKTFAFLLVIPLLLSTITTNSLFFDASLVIFSNIFFVLIGLLACLVILIVSFVLYIKHKTDILFLFAWSIFLGSIITLALSSFGLFTISTWFATYSLQMASIIEIVVLSLILGQRIRRQQEEKHHIEKQLIKTQAELVETLSKSEKDLEEKVLVRTQQLEQSVKTNVCLLDEYIRFSAYLSHELRNPLSIIQNQTSLLEMMTIYDKNEMNHRISSINHAALRLKNLFDEWIGNYRICRKDQFGSFTQVDICEVVNDVLSLLDDTQKTLVEWQHTGNCFVLTADESMLRMAIYNLVDNAIKYAKSDSKITIFTTKDDNNIAMIKVKDHGIGLNKDQQRYIFDDYHRVKGTDNPQGTGLGLGLVKRVAELHRGELTLISEIGYGCEFSLIIPIVKID